MRLALLAIVGVLAACGPRDTARIHELRHPSGFVFALPALAKPWHQELRNDIVVVTTGSAPAPELQLLAFAPRSADTSAALAERITAEVIRPGIMLPWKSTAASKAARVAPIDHDTIAGAEVTTGELVLDDERVAFAVVHRAAAADAPARSLIVLAIARRGMYERGVLNFRAVLRGLAPPAPPRH